MLVPQLVCQNLADYILGSQWVSSSLNRISPLWSVTNLVGDLNFFKKMLPSLNGTVQEVQLGQNWIGCVPKTKITTTKLIIKHSWHCRGGIRRGVYSPAHFRTQIVKPFVQTSSQTRLNKYLKLLLRKYPTAGLIYLIPSSFIGRKINSRYTHSIQSPESYGLISFAVVLNSIEFNV